MLRRGDSTGDLHKLADKRVAVIGTGATAVQVVPHVGAAAQQLYVIQRTPSSVDIRNNADTSPEFASEFLSKPGWQRERMDNFMRMVQTSGEGVHDLVQDGWTDIIRNLQVRLASALTGRCRPLFASCLFSAGSKPPRHLAAS